MDRRIIEPVERDRRIRPVTPDDLKFVTSLMKTESDALGFLPYEALEWYASESLIWESRENDDPIGYLVARHLDHDRRTTSIIQACVRLDARRRTFALRLVDHVAKLARGAGRSVLQCWCRDDLAAVDFWRAAGFTEVDRKLGGKARKRVMICFRRPLDDDASADLGRPSISAGGRSRFAGRHSSPNQLNLFEPNILDDVADLTKGFRK